MPRRVLRLCWFRMSRYGDVDGDEAVVSGEEGIVDGGGWRWGWSDGGLC